MATVTVTPSDTTEAATLTQCRAKFGPTVMDDLVTNWLKGHADAFKRQQVEDVLKAADLDPAVKTALAAVSVSAKVVLDAEAAKVVKPIAEKVVG